MARGSEVFAPGQSADAMLILLSGTLRIEQQAQSGRDIVLYRVQGGESCILTAACLLADEDYAATGIAETDIEALSLPRAAFDDLMARSAEFRGLVFRAYADRITDLLSVIDEVAFRRIDIRLADRLLALADSNAQIVQTQAQIATELGTAREVVSRQLQEFQRRGWVTLGRGSVTVLDAAALRRLAQSDQPDLRVI
jgi:CRP/FNR family transcriptional regulator